ncbi:MAG: hypothetical protein JWO01_2658 [Microbacteriaceae bacterium]|nr:hypothetical protein [Microbacteriaceae bacterium]
MSLPSHRTSLITTVLTWVALGILAVIVLLAEVVLFQTARSMADRNPEFAHLEGPLVAAAIAFGVCVEAVLVITALLVGSIRRGRIFDKAALTLVDALVFALIVATALVAAVLPTIPGPPALAFALLGGVLAGMAFVLVVLVLRSLLRQAASMRLELDEVV